MNNGFKIAQSVARMGPETLTHTQKVQRLYRHGLKTLGSWAIDRNVFLNEADVMRAAFESNRASERGASLLAQGEEKLFDFTHSDPYCQPYMPGGSKFMRNPTIPLIVSHHAAQPPPPPPLLPPLLPPRPPPPPRLPPPLLSPPPRRRRRRR